jgi:NitT/TauT family transport system permease protein
MKNDIVVGRLAILGSAILVWEISKFYIPEIFLSPPSAIVIAISSKWAEYLMHLRVTLIEMLLGFTIAMSWGVIMGNIVGSVKRLEKVLDPLIMAFYSVPIIALAPLFILIFGIGYFSKVAIAGIYAGFPVLINTIAGVKNVDNTFHIIAKVFNLKKRQVLFKIILPATAPYLVASLRLCLTFSLIAVIVGEFVSAQAGLGWLISYASFTFQTSTMYGGIVMLALIGYTMNTIIRHLEIRLFKWHFTRA